MEDPAPDIAVVRKRPEWLERAGAVALDAAGEVVAVLLGLALAWCLALAALVERGGADVTALVPSVEEGIARAFAREGLRAEAEVGSLRLVVVAGEDRATLLGRSIVVRSTEEDGEGNGEGSGGGELDRLERLRADLRLSALVGGEVELLALDVEGGTLSVLREADGDTVAGLGPPDALGTLGPVVELGGEGGGRDLPLTSVRGAMVHLVDRRDGVDWVLRDTAARVSRRSVAGTGKDDVETRARVVGVLEANGVRAPLSVGYGERGGVGSLSVAAAADDLSAFAAERGPLSWLARARVPVRRLRAERVTEGGGASLDFEVEAGPGVVAGVDVETLAASGTFAGDVLRLDAVEMSAAGADLAGVDLAGEAVVTLARGEDGLEGIAAELDLSRFAARVEALPVDELVLDTPELEVAWSGGRLGLPRFDVGLEGTRFRGSAAAEIGEGGLEGLEVELDADGPLAPATLLALWPEGFVGGARRWIARSVLDGRIEDLRLRADLPPSFFAGGSADGERAAIPDEAMNLSFRVEDGRVRYISTMSPLEGASGRGRLTGNTFRFALDAGRVGELGVRSASVVMPRLVPKGGDFTIEVRGEGEAEKLLRLIDEEPFRYASRYNLDPAQFSGRGEVEMTVTRPLREFITMDQVSYSVAGDFTGVSIPFALGGQGLTDGELRIEADASKLSLEGPVSFGSWRPTLTYLDTLGDDGSTPTRARLEGVVGREALDGFGVGLRRFVGGNVPVTVDAVSDGMSLLYADVEAELGAAELSLPPWWSKPAGVPAVLRAQLSRTVDGVVVLDGVELEAPDMELRGRATLEGDARLREAVVERIAIADVMELGMSVVPNTERTRLVARVDGSFIDLGPAIRERLSGSRAREGQREGEGEGEGEGVPVRLEARFDRVALVDGYMLEDAGAEYESDGATILSAELEGVTRDGAARLALVPSGEDGTRELSLSLPDASGAARAVFGFAGTRGGALSLQASVPPPGSGRSVLGEVEVEDLVLVNAPILAQLLSLASLEGLGNTLSGQGLRFAEVESEWAFREGRLSLRRTRASGPALGLTVEGEVDLGARVLDLNGVVVPAYTANSFLGEIPLLGDILVGEEGEGVLGLNYFVQGPWSAAQVGVNPLSALTPGVFREIFKPQREGLPGE